MAPPCPGQSWTRTRSQFHSRLCASRKLCYGNYTLRLFFIGCHRQRQRQLRWLPTLLLLIRSQRSSGHLLRIASRMKTDIDDRLNPQAPAPGTSLEKFHLKWNAKDYCQESHYSTKNHFFCAPFPLPLPLRLSAPSTFSLIEMLVFWLPHLLPTTPLPISPFAMSCPVAVE